MAVVKLYSPVDGICLSVAGLDKETVLEMAKKHQLNGFDPAKLPEAEIDKRFAHKAVDDTIVISARELSPVAIGHVRDFLADLNSKYGKSAAVTFDSLTIGFNDGQTLLNDIVRFKLREYNLADVGFELVGPNADSNQVGSLYARAQVFDERKLGDLHGFMEEIQKNLKTAEITQSHLDKSRNERLRASLQVGG